MSREDEALAAATSFVRSLARQPNSSQRSSSGSSHSSPSSVSGVETLSCKLPGPPSASKEALEAELCALALRIQFLESRVDAVDRTLPDTPNESQMISATYEIMSQDKRKRSNLKERRLQRSAKAFKGQTSSPRKRFLRWKRRISKCSQEN
jgi:hypothetical protein